MINIICESACHKSYFEKINNAKYVGENLVICSEHALRNLTSQNEHEHMLNDVAKSITASIKLKKSEEIRQELLN